MNNDQRDYWFAVLESELRRGASNMDALLTATGHTAEVYEMRHNPLASAAASAVAAGREPDCKAGDDEPPKVERAWLIERKYKGVPEWLCGESWAFNWTRDSLKAIRFCRREDAEQVAAVVGDEVDCITEHQWGPDLLPPIPCGRCNGTGMPMIYTGTPCEACGGRGEQP